MRKWKSIVSVLLGLLFLVSSASVAQRAQIVVEWMSPQRAINMGHTGGISSGLAVVPKGTVVYLSASDLLAGTITSVSWIMLARPAGSTAVLDSTNRIWTTFRADTTGTYQIQLSVTTSAGSNTTTRVITSAKFTGVGGMGGITPIIGQGQCAGCHNGSIQPDMNTPWRASSHATMFQRGINGQVASYYGASCIRCHTTGYDTQPSATNGGFYDLQRTLNWTFPTPLAPSNFDSLARRYPTLAQVATIGCESCHGPGSLHFGQAARTAKSLSVGVCAQCHDETWRHPITQQWRNAEHSTPVYSTTFRQLSTNAAYRTNSFDNCVRCHAPEGFINLAEGRTTATDSLFAFNLQPKSCAMCHEPHGDTQNPYMLRRIISDTLKNGYVVPSNVGLGGLCMNCHKTRRVGETYPLTTSISSTWSPHYGSETDMYFGQNAHTYGSPVASSIAHRLVENSCVGCHMSATPDTGQVGRDLIGGHSWNMSAVVGIQTVDHTRACVSCHGPMTRFSDIMAAFDYDGDGTIEPFTTEIKGLKTFLSMALPPVGLDSVSWTMIRSSPDSIRMKRAYYNYLFVKYDGSNGVHNPKYSVGLLQRSITQLTGIEFANGELPAEFSLAQNYPNPFNPSTNISFSVPKRSTVRLLVYDIVGRLVATLINEELGAGNYSIPWNGSDGNQKKVSSGVYLYRLETQSYVQTKKMLLLK